jgi:hypothetical protein
MSPFSQPAARYAQCHFGVTIGLFGKGAQCLRADATAPSERLFYRTRPSILDR